MEIPVCEVHRGGFVESRIPDIDHQQSTNPDHTRGDNYGKRAFDHAFMRRTGQSQIAASLTYHDRYKQCLKGLQ